MAAYWLWQHIGYGSILVMAAYQVWQHISYDSILVMAAYWLWPSWGLQGRPVHQYRQGGTPSNRLDESFFNGGILVIITIMLQ